MIENDITRIAKDMLDDGTFEEIVRKELKQGFEKAIESSFNWGLLRKATENRINEVMVPYIEKVDLSNYIVKLDDILTEIVSTTNLQDNKEMLENFKYLMVEPQEKTVKLSQIFEEYQSYVADAVDTDGLDVTTEEGEPEYEAVEARFEVEDQDVYWSHFERKHVLFRVESNNNDDLQLSIELSRYNWKSYGETEEGYEISVEKKDSIKSLRRLNDFELYLLRLERAGVQVIIDKDSDYEYVTPTKEPEVSYI